MIQAVIFDVGGVLVRTADHTPRRELEARLGLAAWQSEEVVFMGEMGQKAQAGEVTDAELWRWVGEHLALDPAGLDDFRQAFWAGDVLDTELVDYIRSLRPRYQTAIISNATDNLRPVLVEDFAIADAFDLMVVSAEERLLKPDPEIYLRTLQRLNRRPEEAVFIDDNQENIAAAQALGMAAVLFKADMDLPAVLAKLGVLPEGEDDEN